MPELNQPQRYKNLALAGLASLAGFVALLITFSALFLGLWLDAITGTRGTWTVVSLVCSVPLSLLAMFWMVLGLVRRIIPQPPPRHKPNKEEIL